MQIRPELRPLYPPRWRELSSHVRFERAEGRCQRCGRPHLVLLRCLPDGRWFDEQAATWRDRRGRPARWPDLMEAIRFRMTRIVLAAAHLDSDPTNNRLKNLRALCQRCHMLHDRPHHLAQRWVTYRRRSAVTRAAGTIESVFPVELAASQVGPTDRAALVVRARSGQQLSQTRVVLRESTDIPPGQDQTALVDAAVPFNPAMAEIDLVLDGNVLARYSNSTIPPVAPNGLQILTAIGGTGPILTWTPAVVGNSGTVTYTVQTSNDGKVWSTIAAGMRKQRLSAPRPRWCSKLCDRLRTSKNGRVDAAGRNDSTAFQIIIVLKPEHTGLDSTDNLGPVLPPNYH
jgi:hypothetical protein